MYCTIEDLQNATSEADYIIPLSDDSNPPGEVDEDKVNECISKADEIIEGYLRGRYTLPLSPVPGLIKTLSIDMSLYRLWLRRPDEDTPKAIVKGYDEAIKMLAQIQKGAILLDLGEEGEEEDTISDSGAREYKTNKTSASKMFSSTILDQFYAG